MKKMTKREIIMVYVMILAIIIGAFFLAMRPLSKNQKKLQVQYDDITMERDIMELSMIDSTWVESAYETEVQRYNANKGKLPDDLSAELMEQYVLKTVEENGIELVGTSISSGSSFSIPGSSSSIYLDDELALDEYEDELYVDEEEEGFSGSGSCMQGNISFVAECTMEELLNLCDAWKKNNAVRITSLSIASEDGKDVFKLAPGQINTENIDTAIATFSKEEKNKYLGIKTFQINVQVYMIPEMEVKTYQEIMHEQ